MGLVIVGISKLKLTKPLTEAELDLFLEELEGGSATEMEAFYKKNVVIYDDEEFPEQTEGLEQGIYERQEGSSDFEMESMSSKVYGAWRDQLWSLANEDPQETMWKNPQDYQDAPFYYLVNFPDNEGVISSTICNKLLGDFEQFHEKAREISDDGSFLFIYHSMMEALKVASDDGVMIFA